MQSDGLNSTLSPVVYGDIALSTNTQYNTICKLATLIMFLVEEILYVPNVEVQNILAEPRLMVTTR